MSKIGRYVDTSRQPVKLAYMLAGSLALAACSPAQPVILTPPEHLLHCADAPAVPDTLPPQGTIERERATVKIWLDEREAGADCRGRLNAVREWWERVGGKVLVSPGTA